VNHPFGPIIDRYTRADAIATGDLVDVSITARQAGIRYPVAVTRAVWEDCIAWTPADSRYTGAVQDQAGRLWDVLWLVAQKLRRLPRKTDRVTVLLWRVSRDARTTKPRMVHLVAVCGPGDDAEPVITIQLPGED
jgi:hypothetical protein